MRDSRIGAHGAVALVLLLAAKIFAVIQLQLQLPPQLHAGPLPSRPVRSRRDWPLFAAPVLARWAVVPLIVFFRYARAAGLGSGLPGARAPAAARRRDRVAAGAAIGGRPAGDSAARRRASVGRRGAGALGVALALAGAAGRRLGGFTGDVYGAAIELAELAVLTHGVSLAANRITNAVPGRRAGGQRRPDALSPVGGVTIHEVTTASAVAPALGTTSTVPFTASKSRCP